MKNWATRLATPSKISKLWEIADVHLSIPCRLRVIMWTNAGNTNTKANPQIAPENLQRGTQS